MAIRPVNHQLSGLALELDGGIAAFHEFSLESQMATLCPKLGHNANLAIDRKDRSTRAARGVEG
jgi:hypothetical protein